MIPHERSLVKKMEGKPFVLIGVNSDDIGDELKKNLEENGVTWRSFRDERAEGAKISEDWAVEGWPTIYLIDHRGVIRVAGAHNLDEDALEKLVKEAEEEKK